MDLRSLQSFLIVAQEQNITRAAERLHIAQPSLSRQMMELENDLGKPLLIRGRRSLCGSPFGHEGIGARRCRRVHDRQRNLHQGIPADGACSEFSVKKGFL